MTGCTLVFPDLISKRLGSPKNQLNPADTTQIIRFELS